MPPRLPGLTVDELAASARQRGARAPGAALALRAAGSCPRALPARIPGVAERAWAAFVAATRVASAGACTARRASADGTTKYALAFGGTTSSRPCGFPARGRSTVCVSSQAGCTRRCVFCATQTLGFARQLTRRRDRGAVPGRARRGARRGAGPERRLHGHGRADGQPRRGAARGARADAGAGAAAAGAVGDGVDLRACCRACGASCARATASLALSLNATTDETRARLMPHDRVWPIAALLGRAARRRGAATRAATRFVEYVLFAGVNDGDADADRLVRLLDGHPARVST